jgi:hypothetical protein
MYFSAPPSPPWSSSVLFLKKACCFRALRVKALNDTSIHQITMLTFDSETAALAFSVAEAALIDDVSSFSDDNVDHRLGLLAPEHLPAAAGFDFEEEVSVPTQGGSPDALFEAVRNMTLQDDPSGSAAAWLFEGMELKAVCACLHISDR